VAPSGTRFVAIPLPDPKIETHPLLIEIATGGTAKLRDRARLPDTIHVAFVVIALKGRCFTTAFFPNIAVCTDSAMAIAVAEFVT